VQHVLVGVETRLRRSRLRVAYGARVVVLWLVQVAIQVRVRGEDHFGETLSVRAVDCHVKTVTVRIKTHTRPGFRGSEPVADLGGEGRHSIPYTDQIDLSRTAL